MTPDQAIAVINTLGARIAELEVQLAVERARIAHPEQVPAPATEGVSDADVQ